MTTDTPRTDAAIEPLAAYTLLLMNVNAVDIVWPEFARQLERELSASKAEVERLKKELSEWDYGTRAKREQERAEKFKEIAKDALWLARTYDNVNEFNRIDNLHKQLENE